MYTLFLLRSYIKDKIQHNMHDKHTRGILCSNNSDAN